MLNVHFNLISLLWEVTSLANMYTCIHTLLFVAFCLQIQVYAGVYHGGEALCKAESTRTMQQEVVEHNPVWNWNENIEFNIGVQ